MHPTTCTFPQFLAFSMQRKSATAICSDSRFRPLQVQLDSNFSLGTADHAQEPTRYSPRGRRTKWCSSPFWKAHNRQLFALAQCTNCSCTGVTLLTRVSHAIANVQNPAQSGSSKDHFMLRT
uniref:(northern house mosquito) hypothetical protein n=1 Tax=Culex pipiens TaxID=7175 RepID=A0A8D8BVG6_CULPI